MKFTNRKGTLRIYDGTGTPFYLELDFDNGDFTGPLGVPKTEEILVMHRGTFDADAHYIEGSDEKVMEPADVSFSATVEDTTITTYLLDWLEGSTVNSNTIVTTKEDTQRANSVATPAFADSGKKTFNIEYILDGTADVCWHYNEVYVELADASVEESEEGVNISFTGKHYGTITRDTANTAGTDVTD